MCNMKELEMFKKKGLKTPLKNGGDKKTTAARDTGVGSIKLVDRLFRCQT